MPASLFLSDVAASYGDHPLFAGLELTLSAGDVVALVGPNGAGKTTLLRIVAGERAADGGSVRLAPPGATVGYLPQSRPEVGESILDYARRRTGVAAAEAAFDAATADLAAGRTGAEQRYAVALERWLGLGGADLDVRLAEVLGRVGLDVALAQPLGSLSGGQVARAGLATILASHYDVLLLDEPTNNLDLAGLDVLAGFVARVQAPVLVASHDRSFLDAVATSVLELDPVQQSVTRYAGGWSDYRRARARAREQAQEAHDRSVQRRDDLVDQARRKREWARQGRARAAALGPHQGLAKKAKEDRARRMDQRAARVRDAAERVEVAPQPRREWELRYRISEAAPSCDVVVTLDEVRVRAGTFTVGPVSAQVARGDRVVLSGANGSGKTTLLEAMLGRRPVASGRLSWGSRVELGWLDQSREVVSGPGPLAERIAGELGCPPAGARALLATFGLGAGDVGRPCDELSLGERTRAALALLQGRDVNVLVLDEPTNHLDAEAIDQLQAALARFAGTVLLVSHDRALLEAVRPSVVWRLSREADRGRVCVG